MPEPGAGAPPAEAGLPAPGAGGPTAPAAVPPQSVGVQMRGRVAVSLAMKQLLQAAQHLGADTDEGRTVLECVTKLSKKFGDASSDLTRAEVKLQGDKAPAVQQPTPQNGQAFQDMIRQRLQGMGMNGGGPAA